VYVTAKVEILWAAPSGLNNKEQGFKMIVAFRPGYPLQAALPGNKSRLEMSLQSRLFASIPAAETKSSRTF